MERIFGCVGQKWVFSDWDGLFESWNRGFDGCFWMIVERDFVIVGELWDFAERNGGFGEQICALVE